MSYDLESPSYISFMSYGTDIVQLVILQTQVFAEWIKGIYEGNGIRKAPDIRDADIRDELGTRSVEYCYVLEIVIECCSTVLSISRKWTKTGNFGPSVAWPLSRTAKFSKLKLHWLLITW